MKNSDKLPTSNKAKGKIKKMSIIQCNKDCTKCKYLSGRIDNKGYPFGYECLKYVDSVFREKFGDTKEFHTNMEIFA